MRSTSPTKHCSRLIGLSISHQLSTVFLCFWTPRRRCKREGHASSHKSELDENSPLMPQCGSTVKRGMLFHVHAKPRAKMDRTAMLGGMLPAVGLRPVTNSARHASMCYALWCDHPPKRQRHLKAKCESSSQDGCDGTTCLRNVGPEGRGACSLARTHAPGKMDQIALHFLALAMPAPLRPAVDG
jgi:hypothetical protein